MTLPPPSWVLPSDVASASKTGLNTPVLAIWVADKAEGNSLDSDIRDAAVEDCGRSLGAWVAGLDSEASKPVSGEGSSCEAVAIHFPPVQHVSE